MQVDANLALVGFDAEKDFDAIVSADLFERLKPAPDIFLAAAKQVPYLLWPSNQAMLIFDSCSDLPCVLSFLHEPKALGRRVVCTLLMMPSCGAPPINLHESWI